MRTTGICIWLLLNIMLMGMMGYMYLLWVQYWRYARNVAAIGHYSDQDENRLFHFEEEVGIQIRKGRPRIRPNSDFNDDAAFLFPMYDPAADAKEAHHVPITTTTPIPVTLSVEEQRKVIEKHKDVITVHLRTFQMDSGKSFLQIKNRYGVKYRGPKERGVITRDKILCALQKAQVRTLRDGDEPFTVEGMAKYFPHEGILEGQHFNACAIVSSAGSLKGSGLGKFIDSHDAVIRFNDAPVKGHEKDVGFKTTLRVINSRIPTQPKFDFWGSPLYRNITLLLWDPSNYSSSLAEWYASPDFPVFPEYFRRRLMFPHESFHFLHPASAWRIWDVLQMFTNTHLLPNPPTSGLSLMLHHCNWVNVMEFIPSTRYSDQCHYWEAINPEPGCTFGSWHPMSTEKLLCMLLNVADDVSTYVTGFITIPGFSQLSCPTKNPG